MKKQTQIYCRTYKKKPPITVITKACNTPKAHGGSGTGSQRTSATTHQQTETEPQMAQAKMRKEYIGSLVLATQSYALEAVHNCGQMLAKGQHAYPSLMQHFPTAEQLLYQKIYQQRPPSFMLDACVVNAKSAWAAVGGISPKVKSPALLSRYLLRESPCQMVMSKQAEAVADQHQLILPANNLQHLSYKLSNLSTLDQKPRSHQSQLLALGMISIDEFGNFSGAITGGNWGQLGKGSLSEAAHYGAGLYADADIGIAVCTGDASLITRYQCSFLIVELMRCGASPFEACWQAIQRIAYKRHNEAAQINCLAINTNTQYGAYSLKDGFKYVLYRHGETQVLPSVYYYETV